MNPPLMTADIRKSNVITAGTLVPIGVIVALSSVIAAAIWWAACMQAKVDYTAVQLSEVRVDMREMKTDLAAIRAQLAKTVSVR